MPLYEYICESCGRTLEAFQSFSEKPLSICERCGGRLRRLISPPAIQFKGSGWYISDYARPRASNGSSEGGKAEGENPKGEPGPGGPPKASSSKEPSGGTSSATDSSNKDT